MNDFTKEELWTIFNCIDIVIKRLSLSDKNSIHHRLVRDKAHSLIDNYCDHKGAMPGLMQYTTFRCDKCGKDPI